MTEEIGIGTEGRVVNYRQSRRKIHPKWAILEFPSIKNKPDAGRELVGHTVAWVSPTGKYLKGKITKPHGKNGAVKAHFKKKGLPGQALGDKVKIVK